MVILNRNHSNIKNIRFWFFNPVDAIYIGIHKYFKNQNLFHTEKKNIQKWTVYVHVYILFQYRIIIITILEKLFIFIIYVEILIR